MSNGRQAPVATCKNGNAKEARLQPLFDADWRRLALRGDQAAVRALADAALQPLYCFCFYRVGRNRHVCEEVVQETLARALRELEAYDPRRAGNRIFPWLTGLARNEIQRALYARLDSEPLAEEVLLREETRELVNATMSQLPPHYREALEAKYLTGKSVHDMASSWSTTDKAVESLLSRARNAFRATFLTLARNLGPELP